MWDDRFERIVRDALPFLPADRPLDADVSLLDHGLDSFGIIELLVAVESGYGIRFRDEAMNRETFQTPESLWAVVSSLSAA